MLFTWITYNQKLPTKLLTPRWNNFDPVKFLELNIRSSPCQAQSTDPLSLLCGSTHTDIQDNKYTDRQTGADDEIDI